jgi:hypothetical protein
MAKAVVPVRAFREKFGEPDAERFPQQILDLMTQFLHEHQLTEKRREPVRA